MKIELKENTTFWNVLKWLFLCLTILINRFEINFAVNRNLSMLKWTETQSNLLTKMLIATNDQRFDSCYFEKEFGIFYFLPFGNKLLFLFYVWPVDRLTVVRFAQKENPHNRLHAQTACTYRHYYEQFIELNKNINGYIMIF
jgi:hypothetical protein